MVTHFVCHTLGRLQDDKLTMTPIGLSTQSPLERGRGFQHSLCQEAGAVIPGVLPPLSERGCQAWGITARLCSCLAPSVALPPSRVLLSLLARITSHSPDSGRGSNSGCPPGGLIVKDLMNWEEYFCFEHRLFSEDCSRFFHETRGKNSQRAGFFVFCMFLFCQSWCQRPPGW